MGAEVNQRYTEHCNELAMMQNTGFDRLVAHVHTTFVVGAYLDLEPDINDAFASCLVCQGEHIR